MPLYKLIVAYDGTRFNGFQRQTATQDILFQRPTKRPHFEATTGRRKRTAVTIQECLEHAISDWSGHSIPDLCLRFAGRTDKGVHAQGQVVTVTLDHRDDSLVDFHKAINSRLPCDISVQHVTLCTNTSFDPRRDAKLKRYSYTLKYRRRVLVNDNDNSDEQLLPICHSGPNTIRSGLDPPCLWIVPWALDDSMRQGICQKLQGRHDFGAFVHKEVRDDGDHVLHLERFDWTIVSETDEPAPIVTARIAAESKGFRRSMVRNLVGFCVDVCRYRDKELANLVGNDDTLWRASEQVASLIHAAPASGLCLDWIKYE